MAISLKVAALGTVLFLFAGCGVSPVNVDVDKKSTGDSKMTTVCDSDNIYEGYFLNQPIHYMKDADGKIVFQGDIILKPAWIKDGKEMGKTSSAIGTSLIGRWPNGLIPYSVSAGFPNLSVVQAAITDIQNKTCIRFVSRTNQTDYVLFQSVSGGASSSLIGRTGGQQIIYISTEIAEAILVEHEIAHACGLFHEHSRTDRDSYVTINWDNIIPQYSWCFDQFDPDYGMNFNGFDYNSIMIYHSWNFSKSSGYDLPTMVKKNGAYIYSAMDLSQNDIYGLVGLYLEKWANDFGRNQGWVCQYLVPRTMADVNGDGKQDIVAFASNGVYVSLSNGVGFNAKQLWIANFGINQGWNNQDVVPRMLADVNGDGKADIIGFASDGAYVSLSTGSAFNAKSRWIANFGINQGWTRQMLLPRIVADVNNDGKADIVGFASDGAYVSLSNGSSFGTRQKWISHYGINQGWSNQDIVPRTVADVNGDGKADVIGFATDAVYVSLSTGTSFGTRTSWLVGYGYNQGWVSQNLVPRDVADIDSDNKADIVGFASDGVYISKSNGSSFSTPVYSFASLGLNKGGWIAQDTVPRMVAKVKNEGGRNCIGFATDGVYFLDMHE